MKTLKNILLSGLTLFLLGCSKEPNAVGIDLLPAGDFPTGRAIELKSTASHEYSMTTSNNTITLMLGKFSNGNNYVEAKTLIKFTTTTVDSIFLNSIIDAEIKLQPIYAFPDTQGTLSFTIHKMLRDWTDYSFTNDSLKIDYYESTPVNNYDLMINAKDTLALKFKLDRNLVISWLKGDGNNGLVLIPKINSTNIFGFRSGDLYSFDAPQLVITYQLPEDTASKTLILSVGKDATLFSGNLTNTSNDLIFLQGGIINRSVLKFSVDSIPRSAYLLQAELVLYVDTLLCRFSAFTEKKILAQEILEYDSIPTRLGSYSASSSIFGDSVVIDVQPIVQKWITAKPNLGLVLRAYNEFTEIEKFAIFSHLSTKFPRLKIKYQTLE